MSEVRLVVREAGRDWSGKIHGSCADRAIAALSADPTTLAELEAAVARFAKPDPKLRYFSNLKPGLRDEPHDAGLVVIDLAARLVVADSTYFVPRIKGGVEYHNGKSCTTKVLPFHLADDWQISNDALVWRSFAERLRAEWAAKPVIDFREILYGRPMLQFMARGVFEALGPNAEHRASADAAEADRKVREVISRIHADWLLTPREDLGGVCPRERLLERRGHIVWDMQDRCESWSLTGVSPPPIAETYEAYRLGGFGTHELVMYYELVREILADCWEQCSEREHSLSTGDFLAAEIPRLEGVREAWLDEPNIEFHLDKPRRIIESERRRIPEAMTGPEMVVDPDCPCCQMLADMPGVGFWNLDGSGMDDDFAFDIYHRTREEWDAEQREWEERSRQWEAESKERERLGVSYEARESDSIWKRSLVLEGGDDAPVGMKIFGIGCKLAELIVGLRDGKSGADVSSASQAHIDRLNRSFGNLREVLQSPEESLAIALIEPVLDRFKEALDDLATDRPELAKQCESLRGTIRNLFRPVDEFTGLQSDEDDIPF